MRARLEVDVDGCATGALAGLFQGENFGMFEPVISVGAGADDFTRVGHNDGADVGIRRSQTNAAAGEFKRLAKKIFVGVAIWHASIGAGAIRVLGPCAFCASVGTSSCSRSQAFRGQNGRLRTALTNPRSASATEARFAPSARLTAINPAS